MIGLHATADANGQPWPGYEQADRIVPILLRSILYIARTELFIIISVFLLFLALDKRSRSYKTVLQQQSSRLILPFVFWTIFFSFYGLFKAYNFGYFDYAVAELTSPKYWFDAFILGTSKYHMHFIPTLFGVLLLFPIYRVAIDHPEVGFAIVALLLVKQQLDTFIYSQFWDTDILPFLVRANKILTYAGYGLFAASCYGIVKKGIKETRKWLPVLLLSGLLLYLLKLTATWKTIENGVYPYSYVAGYWADFLMPCALFLGCMLLGNSVSSKTISNFAKYSFGLYLCHPIFLDIAEVALQLQSLLPIVQIALKLCFALPLTFAFVWTLSQSHLLGWTVGLKPLPYRPRQKAQVL